MQRDHHIRIQGEDGHLQARERGLKGSQPCGSLTLDPWPLELWESMGLLFKPLSSSYFTTEGLANKYRILQC